MTGRPASGASSAARGRPRRRRGEHRGHRAHGACRRVSHRGRQLRGHDEVVRIGDLHVAVVAGNAPHPDAGIPGHAGRGVRAGEPVGGRPFVGGQQRGGRESLRRLHGHHRAQVGLGRGAVLAGQRQAVPGHAGHRAARLPGRREHRRGQFRGDQRPRRVVDQHHVDLPGGDPRSEPAQRHQLGFLAHRAAVHDLARRSRRTRRPAPARPVPRPAAGPPAPARRSRAPGRRCAATTRPRSGRPAAGTPCSGHRPPGSPRRWPAPRPPRSPPPAGAGHYLRAPPHGSPVSGPPAGTLDREHPRRRKPGRGQRLAR